MIDPRMTRRRFIKTAGATGMFSIVSSIGSMEHLTAWAAPGAGEDTVLVSIFLRGAADALNIICPHGDGHYYRQRGRFGLDAGEFKDIDGFFGLNNDFEAIHHLLDSNQMAAVHATGIPQPERSHFEAQAIMDTGVGTSGWLQRAIAASAFANDRAGLSMGDRTNPQLVGPFGGTIINTVDQAAESGMDIAVVRPALEALYNSPLVPALEREAVLDAFVTIDEIADVVETDGRYPNSNTAQTFREAATLIRADLGIRAIAINVGSWDHHSNGRERMLTRGRSFSRALAAFFSDLGSDQRRVIVVASSEFGRSAAPNGSGGTEHGWGGSMLVVGDRLRGHSGGQVLTPGGWPGLANRDLFDGRDLQVTTDFRSVYAELIDRHLGVGDTTSVFPGLDRQAIGLLPARAAGDVDSSGSVTNADVQALLHQNVRNQAQPAIADIDGDGDVDLRDALLLAQQLD